MRLDEIKKIRAEFFDLNNNGFFHSMDTLRSDPNYFRDWKKIEWDIVWMRPSEYLNRCREGFKNNEKTTHGDPIGGRDTDKILKYAQLMVTNRAKFPMPNLVYQDGHFTQEGIHRAQAVKMIEDEYDMIIEIPVFIVNYGKGWQ